MSGEKNDSAEIAQAIRGLRVISGKGEKESTVDILRLVLLVVGSLYGLIAAVVLVFATAYWVATTDYRYEDETPVGIVPRIFLTIIGVIVAIFVAIVWPIFAWQGLKATLKSSP